MSKRLLVEAALSPGSGPRAEVGTSALAAQAEKLEALGFDRTFTTEGRRDPFLPLAIAADHTTSLELGTAIAVAFGRSPMTVALAAQDLNLLSNGRFRLGLGSQIRTHITRRFDMPWHGAARQMRDFIAAVRAIWDCWWDGVPLNHDGEFYRNSLMTPEFTPHTAGLRRPPILLAAVGPLMLETASAVADGLIVHPFCTEQYLSEVIVPQIQPGLRARGLTLDDFEIHYPILIATGTDEEQFERAKAAVRRDIGFCGSTPAYRRVLELHGWGDLHPRLRQLTRDNRWDRLGDLIDDEVLHTFAAVGEPTEVAQTIRTRLGGVAGSVVLDPTLDPAALSEQLAVLHQD